MLERILTLAILAGGGYWYWTGPYQAQTNPNYAQRQDTLQEDMKTCIHSMNYRQGAGANVRGIPEEVCAEKYNLYMGDDGRWHSFDDVEK